MTGVQTCALPISALQDSLAVLNGSPNSQDLFSQLLSQAQNNRTNSAIQQQQDAAFWQQLATLLPNLGL